MGPISQAYPGKGGALTLGPLVDQLIAFLRALPSGLFYVLLFLGFLAEGTSLPFLQIPTILMFLASAILVSSGKLGLTGAILVAAAGSTVGAFIAYRIGVKLGGHASTDKITRTILREEDDWSQRPRRSTRVAAWVGRYGALLVFAARWLGVLRPTALLAAGMSRLHPVKVFAALLSASLCYCTLFQLLALEFQAVSLRLLRKTEIELVVVTALLFALAWVAGYLILSRARSRA